MVGSGCYSPFKFSGKHLDAEGFRFFGRDIYIYIYHWEILEVGGSLENVC